MTFNQAREILGNRKSKKVANNTYFVVTTDRAGAPAIGLRLHNTNVLVFSADGSVQVNTGGWQTVTTKDRINSYLPCNGIYQQAGTWFWNILGGHPEKFDDGDIIFPVGNGLFRRHKTKSRDTN